MEADGDGLVARGVGVRFSGVHAIEDVSIALRPGEIVGLVGPNGAGKTTLVNVLSGFQRPNAGGRVWLDGEPIAGWPPDRIARRGAARTFQAVRLFTGLTVSQNVEAALAAGGTARGAARREAMRLLDYLGIAARAHAPGDGLSYGDERRVGIARALALAPRYLMLDEPAAGMNLGRGGGAGRPHRPHPERSGLRRPAHRAQYEPRGQGVRAAPRPVQRAHHRRRNPGRGDGPPRVPHRLFGRGAPMRTHP